jgi:hypothetical protein
MKLKFIVDECMGISVVQWLRNKHYDVISIIECMAGSADDAVLAKAVQENRILITADKDFGDIVFHQGARHCGIILLRLSDETPKNKLQALEELFEKHWDCLANNFVVVADAGIRVIEQNIH